MARRAIKSDRKLDAAILMQVLVSSRRVRDAGVGATIRGIGCACPQRLKVNGGLRDARGDLPIAVRAHTIDTEAERTRGHRRDCMIPVPNRQAMVGIE